MKTKSGKNPNKFKIKQHTADETTNATVLVRWNVIEKTVEDLNGETHTEYEYDEELINLNFDREVSRDEVLNYCQNNETGLLNQAKEIHSRKIEKEKKRIDEDTGRTISYRTHNEAQEREEIGILRNQMVSIVNESGLSTTEEFEKLNEIAREEINKGIDRKEDL